MKTLVRVVSVGALLLTTGGAAARAQQRTIQEAASAGQVAESAARMLDLLIASLGWEAGAAEYRKKVAGNTQYSVVEREFIALGSRYLQSGRMREAIAVFEIATEALPDAWNAWNSLGDACLVATFNPEFAKVADDLPGEGGSVLCEVRCAQSSERHRQDGARPAARGEAGRSQRNQGGASFRLGRTDRAHRPVSRSACSGVDASGLRAGHRVGRRSPGLRDHVHARREGAVTSRRGRRARVPRTS